MFRQFRAHWPVAGVLLGLAPAFALAVLLARTAPCRMTYAGFEAQFGSLGIHRCPGDPLCRLVVRGEEVLAFHFHPDAAKGGLCLARTERRTDTSVASLQGTPVRQP